MEKCSGNCNCTADLEAIKEAAQLVYLIDGQEYVFVREYKNDEVENNG